MKRFLIFIFSISSVVFMQAQTTTTSPAGEYYLTGVMETASGFRLNEDGSFNFFFSYGALDREGSGKWKQEGNTIIFNSIVKPNHDYTLLQSNKQSSAGISVHIKEPNEHVRKLVHAVIKNGNNEEQPLTDDGGISVFKSSSADSIILAFEWCPDKIFSFAVKDKTHNYFEFKIEPSITEVLFTNFKLQLDEEGLEGPHPLDESKSFHYNKAEQHTEPGNNN